MPWTPKALAPGGHAGPSGHNQGQTAKPQQGFSSRRTLGLLMSPLSPCACRSPGYLGGSERRRRGEKQLRCPCWAGSGQAGLCVPWHPTVGCDTAGELGVGAGSKSSHSWPHCPQCGGDTHAGTPRFLVIGSFSWGETRAIHVGAFGVSVHGTASPEGAGKTKEEEEDAIWPWLLPRRSLPALFTAAGEEGLDPVRQRGRGGRAEGRIWPPTFASSSSSSSSPLGAGLAQQENRHPGTHAPGKGQGEGKRAREAADRVLFSGKQALC